MCLSFLLINNRKCKGTMFLSNSAISSVKYPKMSHFRCQYTDKRTQLPTGISTFHSLMCCFLHNQYAQLIQPIHREHHHAAGKQVRRSDDSRDNAYQNKGMAAILTHESCLQNSHLGQKERQHRELEHQAHQQGQRHKG